MLALVCLRSSSSLSIRLSWRWSLFSSCVKFSASLVFSVRRSSREVTFLSVDLSEFSTCSTINLEMDSFAFFARVFHSVAICGDLA